MPRSVHTTAYKWLCQTLVAARHKAGLTQAQVAEGIGRPQSFVAKVEGGERRLDVVELVEICRLLSADPEKIIRSLQAKV